MVAHIVKLPPLVKAKRRKLLLRIGAAVLLIVLGMFMPMIALIQSMSGGGGDGNDGS